MGTEEEPTIWRRAVLVARRLQPPGSSALTRWPGGHGVGHEDQQRVAIDHSTACVADRRLACVQPHRRSDARGFELLC
jgi:hypothetical protein